MITTTLVIFYSLLFVALCRRVSIAAKLNCSGEAGNSGFIGFSCMLAIAGLAIGALAAFSIDPATGEHFLSPSMRVSAPLIGCAVVGLLAPAICAVFFVIASIFSLYGKCEDAIMTKVKLVGKASLEKRIKEIDAIREIQAELDSSDELNADVDRKIVELKSYK